MNPESKTMLTIISGLLVALTLIGFLVITSCTYNIHLVDDPEKQQKPDLQDSQNKQMHFQYYYKGRPCH